MIRRPLGRGLDALIGNGEPEGVGGAPGLMMLGVDRIVAGPFQPRLQFDPERLLELTRTIRSQGLVEPLLVRPAREAGADGARYELIAGERRLRASREAGLSAVPVIVRELDDRAALEMSLVENLAREQLNAIEEARAFSRLAQEFGLSHEEIGARIGKSRPYVSNTLRLLDLPPEVVEMIARGQLAPGQARPLLALGSADAQRAAARRVVEGRISARGAEQLASAHRSARGVARRPAPNDAELQALAEGLQRALKRKVRIVTRRGKSPGRIEIDYYDDNDLTALAAMLTGAGRAQADHA